MVEIHFHSLGHAQPNVTKEKDNTELLMIFYSANTKESVQNKKMNENVDIPAEIFKANILAEVDTYVDSKGARPLASRKFFLLESWAGDFLK